MLFLKILFYIYVIESFIRIVFCFYNHPRERYSVSLFEDIMSLLESLIIMIFLFFYLFNK